MAFRTGTTVDEEVPDVFQTARRLVNEVFTFAGSKESPRDREFLVFREILGQLTFDVGKGQGDRGHSNRFSGFGAVEDHILHLFASEDLGPLLARNPQNGIDYIALAPAVRPDNRSDTRLESDSGFIAERFKPEEF